MGLFDRLRKPAVTTTERQIVPNRAVRSSQLMQLESAILDVLDEMEKSSAWLNPRWQAQSAEFSAVVTAARDMRQREYDWQELMDVAFEVRPVIKGGQVPEGMDHLVELQDKMMAIAIALTTPRDDEVLSEA